MPIFNQQLKIKHLKKKDMAIAQQLFVLFQQVFEADSKDIPTTAYLEKLLKNPAFVCYAAIYNKQVIGGLTAYELPMYHAECSEMFIYDIAVFPQFQKKGVGKALLKAVNAYSAQRNIQVMFVDAAQDDHNALEFYRSTGATEQPVAMFCYEVKPS
jgi:aminoglycoside 3-N-acetyltransferase I